VLDDFSAKRTAPHYFSDALLHEHLSQARASVARLINASVEEIALTTNTSFGVNIAALALPVAAGELVLLSDREFPANVYPWLQLRERGIDVELVANSPEGWPDESRLLERLRDPRVRVLAVSLVQFSNGYRADLDRLSEACRTNGTFLVVDAIQGLGQCPLDVQSTPIDVLSCGGQKWLLSPWGSGFVYVRRELLSRLVPPMAGWLSFEGTDDFGHLTEYNPTYRQDARRFEVGTLPVQNMVAMTESVNLLLELGVDRIATYLKMIRQPLMDAAARGELELTSPADVAHESSIVCVRTEHVAESYHALKRGGVVCVMREGSIRFSPHCYNTVDELEKVIEILRGP
jgi:selenocysteine lyase/cysteine desulfurase